MMQSFLVGRLPSASAGLPMLCVCVQDQQIEALLFDSTVTFELYTV